MFNTPALLSTKAWHTTECQLPSLQLGLTGVYIALQERIKLLVAGPGKDPNSEFKLEFLLNTATFTLSKKFFLNLRVIVS